MNTIFFALAAIAFLVTAFRQITFVAGAPDAMMPMDVLTQAIIKSAGGAVELAIGLIGVMALFLGLMKIVEEGGMLKMIARLMKPLMVRLFPEVPAEHPAMGAMIMNLSANFLGLGNAATPFGIKAMEQLNSLNTEQGTATNAMALFLAINTAGLTLIPSGVIALRASSGSHDPAGIVPTTLFATLSAMFFAIFAAKFLQRFFPGGQSVVPTETVSTTGSAEESELLSSAELGESYPLWASVLALLGVVAVIPLMMVYGNTISPWIIPSMIVGMLTFGVIRRVPVYEVFINGAKEGFDIAFRIIPYLVGILVIIAMFRESGAMDLLITPLGRFTSPLGLPPEGLTMAVMRSLSGSGSFGLLASYLQNPAIGPDSYKGYLLSTMYGSTETTFYVLAVYFGAVGIKRVRHALLTGVLAETSAVIASIFICSLLHGGAV